MKHIKDVNTKYLHGASCIQKLYQQFSKNLTITFCDKTATKHLENCTLNARMFNTCFDPNLEDMSP